MYVFFLLRPHLVSYFIKPRPQHRFEWMANKGIVQDLVSRSFIKPFVVLKGIVGASELKWWLGMRRKRSFSIIPSTLRLRASSESLGNEFKAIILKHIYLSINQIFTNFPHHSMEISLNDFISFVSMEPGQRRQVFKISGLCDDDWRLLFHPDPFVYSYLFQLKRQKLFLFLLEIVLVLVKMIIWSCYLTCPSPNPEGGIEKLCNLVSS